MFQKKMASVQENLDVAIRDPPNKDDNFLNLNALFHDKNTPMTYTDYYIERIVPRWIFIMFVIRDERIVYISMSVGHSGFCSSVR
jgi:hypothetical protein